MEDKEVIFGVASIRQREAEELVKSINQSKRIKAILLGFPPYLRPSQEELMVR